MGRYKKIEDDYYKDEKTNALSFDGHTTFLTFLTHDTLNSLGMMKATADSFAYSFSFRGEEFPKRFKEGLQELFQKGLLKQSKTSPLIYAPNFIKYNLPENPNVIKGWYKCIKEFQVTEELCEYLCHIREILKNSDACKPWVLESFDGYFNGYVNRFCNGLVNSSINQSNRVTEEQSNKDVSNDTNVSSLPSSGGGVEKEKLVSKKSFKENPQDIEPIQLDDNPLMVEAEKVLEKYRNICRKLFGSDTTRLDKVVLDAFEVAKWLEAGATSELILAVLENGLMSKGSQPATVGYFKQSVAQAISSAKESFDVSAYAKAGSKAFSNLSYEEQDRQSRKAAWKRAEEEAKRKLAAKELANGK